MHHSRKRAGPARPYFGEAGRVTDVPGSTARATSGGIIPFRSYCRIRNFGDAINPDIIESVSGATPFFSTREAPHLLGIGSIFASASPESYVWGSGIHRPDQALPDFDPAKVRALRGKLTHAALRAQGYAVGDVPLGDPGYLVGRLLGDADLGRVRHKACVIPHHNSFHQPVFRRLTASPEVALVDMMDESMRPLRQIAASEVVISQSLHGLVFAQALGKPSLWISKRFDAGWEFKFHDWYSTTRGPAVEPVDVRTPIEEMIARATLRECEIDTAALTAAMPADELRQHPAEPIVDHHACRRAGPVVLRCGADMIAELSDGFTGSVAQRLVREIVGEALGNWSVPVYTALVSDMRITQGQLAAMTRHLDENPVLGFALLDDAAALDAHAGIERRGEMRGGIVIASGVVNRVRGLLLRPSRNLRADGEFAIFGLPQ
jgi:hypothetical protein